LGNPLRGDDGVGAAVLEQLMQTDLPACVTLHDGGTPGLETVLLLQGHRRAIIVDAADLGRAPGEWVRFTPDQVRLQAGGAGLSGTLHSAGLAEALALGEALGVLPGEIVIYGVQPEEIGWSPGLSAPVSAAVPAVCAAILEDVLDHKHDNKGEDSWRKLKS
jgi:hydrogenase maturation protease